MKYVQIATVHTDFFNLKKITSHIRFRADEFDSRQVQFGGQLKSVSNDSTLGDVS